MLEIATEPDRIADSQVEAWTAELAVLGRDSTVRKFLELQDKIDQTNVIVEAAVPSLSDQLWPYDIYDAFEFARDLAGKRVSIQDLTRLTYGRFPKMSNPDRQTMMDFLIESGFAEVVRTMETGRPAAYRFAPSGDGRTGKDRKRFGLPSNELSGLKAEDLDDVVGMARDARERL